MEPVLGRVCGYRGVVVLVSGVTALVMAETVPVTMSAQQSAIAARSLVFDGVTVIDVEQGKLVPGQRVVIVGNRIQAVGNASVVSVPKSAQVVDARGKYLMPGLWDLHVHTSDPSMHSLLLANGVTGIRDAFSKIPLDTLHQWRREILAGTRVGPPRQILSGAAIDEAEDCSRTELIGHICMSSSDLADARRVVDTLKMAGADMIKTYGLSKEAYFAIAAAARRAGIPFGGHAPAVSAMEATDSGAAILDHLISSNTAPGLDTICTFPQYRSVEQCGAVAERFRRNGTWWVPTMLIHSVFGLTQNWPPLMTPASQAIASRFTMLAGESDTIEMLVGNWLHEAASSSPADSSGLLHLAQRVGMPFLAGTDQTPAGFALHAELAVMVAEGLTPLHALQAATLNPAKLLHGTDSLGTVAPGKLADVVLLDADPLADITNTTTIRAVVANGRYFDRTALDSLLAKVRAEVP